MTEKAQEPGERQVVQASEILEKIQKKVPVEYHDVIIEGDLDLTMLDLPEQRVERTRIGSWVKVTENHHENRMHGIHFGSKHPLHQLLALFSSSRTRPIFGYGIHPRWIWFWWIFFVGIFAFIYWIKAGIEGAKDPIDYI